MTLTPPSAKTPPPPHMNGEVGLFRRRQALVLGGCGLGAGEIAPAIRAVRRVALERLGCLQFDRCERQDMLLTRPANGVGHEHGGDTKGQPGPLCDGQRVLGLMRANGGVNGFNKGTDKGGWLANNHRRLQVIGGGRITRGRDGQF